MPNFIVNNNTQDRIASSAIEFAAREILESYGHNVRISRKSLHKFGRNEVVGTTEDDINYNGIEPVHSSTNSITHFSSSSPADNQTLRVEGMTISGNVLTFVVENITLNGQTKTALTTPLARVTRIANVATPSTATAGDVYVYEDGAVTGGIPDDLNTVGNVMPASDQSTLFAGTSIAGSNYFICTGLYAFVNKKTAASADIKLKIKPVGGVYRAVSSGSISNGAGLIGKYDPYFIIPPNHDIDIVATASVSGVDITAGFAGYFADII